MHIKASSQMFLKFDDFASQRCVTQTIIGSELDTTSAVTIENSFLAVTSEKWRIVPTTAAYKSEDL
jgi:hypothetical protein